MDVELYWTVTALDDRGNPAVEIETMVTVNVSSRDPLDWRVERFTIADGIIDRPRGWRDTDVSVPRANALWAVLHDAVMSESQRLEQRIVNALDRE